MIGAKEAEHRWRRLAFLACAAVIIRFVSPAESAYAQSRLELAPASDWQITRTDTACIARREFSDGQRNLALRMESHGPSNYWMITIEGEALGRKMENAAVEMRMGGERYDVMAVPYVDDGVMTYTLSIPRRSIEERDEDEPLARGSALPFHVDRDWEHRIEDIVLNPNWRPSATLASGPMGDAFSYLHECEESMAEKWGIDLEAHKAARAAAYTVNTAELWPNFVPRVPASADVPNVLATLRVMVDETGRADTCHVQAANVAEYYTDAACRIVFDQGEFYPAVDEQGYGFPSFILMRIVVVLN